MFIAVNGCTQMQRVPARGFPYASSHNVRCLSAHGILIGQSASLSAWDGDVGKFRPQVVGGDL